MPSNINHDAFHKKPLESFSITQKQTTPYFGKLLTPLESTLTSLHLLQDFHLPGGWPTEDPRQRAGRLHDRRRGRLFRVRPQIFELHPVRRLLRSDRPLHGLERAPPEERARREIAGVVSDTAAAVENDIHGESRHRRAVDIV